MSLLTPPPTANPMGRPVALRFLDAHLDHGRLEPHSYRRLREVLQMMNQISLLLFPHSHILHLDVRRRIEALSDAIVGTFFVFSEHIDMMLRRARRAMDELPDLIVEGSEEYYARLRNWRDVLRTLHDPDSKDENLYRHFLVYYDSEVHAPFMQLHREEPEHSSWQLRDRLNRIRECIVCLYEDCEEADRLVGELDAEFAFAEKHVAKQVSQPSKAEEERQVAPIRESEDWRNAVTRAQTTYDMLDSLDEFFESSSSVAGNRSPWATSIEAEYSVATRCLERPDCPLLVRGSDVPRGFSNSSPKLKGSPSKGTPSKLKTRGLRINCDCVGVPTAGNGNLSGAIKVKDFAARTPCLLPSPATLLERREALFVRDTMWRERLIGGQMVQSRRPHDRNRAQTVDERGGGFDAWLSESPSPGQSAERAGSRRLQRQQTL